MSTELEPVSGADTAVAITTDDPTTTALAVRAQTEIQAAITVAKRFPRDVTAAYRELMATTKRKGFASKGRYSFPKGKQMNPVTGEWETHYVTGASVNLAREAARCWGNIRYGVSIIPTEDNQKVIHIEAWAHDAQTNVWAYAQDLFPNSIYDKKNGWHEPDERGRRELVNRRGALNVRNALLQLIPFDIIEDAVNACAETTHKAAADDLDENREDTVRRLVVGFFEDMAIDQDMLEKRLGHSVELVTPQELDELRTVYRQIKDGSSKREDYFDVPAAQAGGVADLNAQVDKKTGEFHGDVLKGELTKEAILCAVPNCNQPRKAHSSNKLKHSFAAPDLFEGDEPVEDPA